MARDSSKSGLELPQPYVEEFDKKTPKEGRFSDASAAPEIDLPQPEFGSSQAPPPTQPAQSQDDSTQAQQSSSQPLMTSQNQAAMPLQASSPLMAEDSDLIEKEWVEKAKKIVEATRDDPYQQNREINKVKADYMKKRYNKDIHLSEE